MENRQSQATQRAAASKPPKGVLEFKGRVFVTTALEEREKKKLRGLLYQGAVLSDPL